MESVTGILLSGGQSKRMGSPKASLKLFGKNLVEYPLKVLEGVCSEVFVVTKSPAPFKSYSFTVLVDEFPNAGPLGGIFTGLKFSHNPWSIVLACDMPYVRRELLEAMVEETNQDSPAEAIVPLAPNPLDPGKLKFHPLCALYSTQCLPVFRTQIIKEELSLKKSLPLLKTKYLNWIHLDPEDSQAISFTNLNTQEEFYQAANSSPWFSKRLKSYC